MKLQGSFVALVTPYAKGEVDLKKVQELVRFHVENGTRGLCPIATTGEGPVLTHDEKAEIVRTVVETAKGKALVFPGTGTYNTAESIELTKMARELGADGALMVTPYYNKPTQEGLFRHYEACAKAVSIPIMLYNVPGRTGVSMAPETTARLSKIRNIVALKDASGNVEQVTMVRTLCDIQILSGEDSLTFAIITLGGVGVVSVAANVIPRQVADMVAHTLKGELDKGRAIHDRYFELFKTLFIETNPIPVKSALKKMGMYNGEMRLPMCEMSASNEEKLEKTLKACKVI
ncbi:MAG TPA: 4-hydroxy-tetrahydrodipicolinate synthase [Planctomycetota bacterium]|nr:4-hydroxy-tetrahydrodipicolinate synthase [Planctomycetota bacterium]